MAFRRFSPRREWLIAAPDFCAAVSKFPRFRERAPYSDLAPRHELRDFYAVDARAAEAMSKNLMKKTYCTPALNIFLKAGVAMSWEVFDQKGLVWRIRLASDDCL